MGKPLEDLREYLSFIFEIDPLLAMFRFYYDKLPIETLSDIKDKEIKHPIILEL